MVLRFDRTRMSRGLASAVCVVAVAAMVAGCTPPPAGAGGDPRLDLVDPQLTDPSLPSEPIDRQFSIRPSITPRNRLVVLFNGTGGVPSSLGRVGRSLAAEGFHVLSLRYESQLGTLDACPHAMVLIDPECHRRLRSEVVYGANVPAGAGQSGYDHLLASVDATTSVMNRLLAYVEYLTAFRPGEGWEQYLQLGVGGGCANTNVVYGRCELRWDRVVAMGYSQGAGVALYLGQHLELDQVAMLAGSFDAFGTSGTYVPAPWVSEPFATDAANIGVLLHPDDSHAGRQRAVANAVGLHDPEVDVSTATPPYSSSRRLITTARPECPFPPSDWAHSAPGGGGCTAEGLHADAWAYLAGA